MPRAALRDGGGIEQGARESWNLLQSIADGCNVGYLTLHFPTQSLVIEKSIHTAQSAGFLSIDTWKVYAT
jgi:hypothetical protein